MVTHKGRIILFGGLEDLASEECEETVFYNDLQQFNLESRRWFELRLKWQERGEEAEASGARALPAPRSHGQLAIMGNVLYMCGGIYETISSEITLDDVWQLDLHKLDEWKCVQANSEKFEWLGDDEGDGGESDGAAEAAAAAAAEDEEGSDAEDVELGGGDGGKKKGKGGKKRSGLKGLLRVMERYLSTHRTDDDVAGELRRLADEEGLSSGEAIQFALKALFVFEEEAEDEEGDGGLGMEEEDHLGALNLFTEDAKGERKVLKWLHKICAKHRMTLRMLPGFVERLLRRNVITCTVVLEYFNESLDRDEDDSKFLELIDEVLGNCAE